MVLVSLALFVSPCVISTADSTQQRRGRPSRQERFVHGCFSVPFLFHLKSHIVLASFAFSACFRTPVCSCAPSDRYDNDYSTARAVSPGCATTDETKLVLSRKIICHRWGVVERFTAACRIRSFSIPFHSRHSIHAASYGRSKESVVQKSRIFLTFVSFMSVGITYLASSTSQP